MDENTKAIVEALEQLKDVVSRASSNTILADILEELKDIGHDVGIMDK